MWWLILGSQIAIFHFVGPLSTLCGCGVFSSFQISILSNVKKHISFFQKMTTRRRHCVSLRPGHSTRIISTNPYWAGDSGWPGWSLRRLRRWNESGFCLLNDNRRCQSRVSYRPTISDTGIFSPTLFLLIGRIVCCLPQSQNVTRMLCIVGGIN